MKTLTKEPAEADAIWAATVASVRIQMILRYHEKKLIEAGHLTPEGRVKRDI